MTTDSPGNLQMLGLTEKPAWAQACHPVVIPVDQLLAASFLEQFSGVTTASNGFRKPSYGQCAEDTPRPHLCHCAPMRRLSSANRIQADKCGPAESQHLENKLLRLRLLRIKSEPRFRAACSQVPLPDFPSVI